MPKSTFLFKKGCLLSWLILIPFIIPAKVVLADYSCYWKNYGGDVCSGGYSTGSGNCSSSDVSSGCMDFYPDSYGGGAELVCDSCSYGCSNGSCNPAPTPTPTPACFRPGTKILIKKRPAAKVSFAQKAIGDVKNFLSEVGKRLEYSLSGFNLKLRNK